MSRIGKLLLSISLLAQAQACFAEEDGSLTLTIGFSGALSGVSESFGKSLANAAELAIADNNRSPFKMNGKRIYFRLLRKDDRGSTEGAADIAAEFVKAGVVGVIAGTNSSTSIAGSPIYAKAGIPQISATATVKQYTEAGSSSTFRMIGIDDNACDFLGKYLIRNLNVHRIAVIDNGSTFGTSISTLCSKVARSYGAAVVSRESIDPTLLDFSSILKNLSTKNADAIFFGGYSSQTGTLAQDMQRLGIKPYLVTSMVGIVGSSFLMSTGAAANGVIAQEAGASLTSMPGWKKFEADFTRHFDFNIYGLTPYAYDAAAVFMAAVRQSNSVDPKKIAETLHQINYKGVTGAVSFDATGNPRTPSFTIYKVQDQKWIALKTDTVR